MKVRASGSIVNNTLHCSVSFLFVGSSLCCAAEFRHQPLEGALPGLNNFFCFLLILFFFVHSVHPATMTFTLSFEFVSDHCTHQALGRLRASRGGLTKRGTDRQKSKQSKKGASYEKTK